MRSTKLTAILLTFLMLLLVLTSAVVFLLKRNEALDQQSLELSEGIESTRAFLESNLAVLESAYEAAGATRDATLRQFNHVEELLDAAIESEAQAETSTAEEDLPLQDTKTELIIFAPSSGDVVHPQDTITIYMVAHDEAGVDRVELAIDDAEPIHYPAGGLITFTLPVRWQVTSEGEHSFSATAFSTEDQASQTETIIVDALYQSDEDRILTAQEAQLSALNAIRFPEPDSESNSGTSNASIDGNLHLKMLTGWDSYDEQSVVTKTLFLQELDFLPSGYTLGDYLQSTEAVRLAYENPETWHVIAVDAIEMVGPSARWHNAHELMHLIQNEKFQLGKINFGALDADARTALRALIEGEAAFLQYVYMQGESFTASERDAILDIQAVSGPSRLDTLPVFLRQDFEFAFNEGFQFILDIVQSGGYEALDAVWRNPPLSTEQILHPDQYMSKDLPVHPSMGAVLEETLAENWTKVDEDTFGEFYLREYLAQTLPRKEAEAAAAGWRGGTYSLFTNENSGSNLFMLLLSWDTPADQEQFDTAFRVFMDQRLGIEGVNTEDGGICWEQDETVCLYDKSGESLILHAPDADVALIITSAIIIP